MMLNLLIAITCTACTDNSIQVNLEKADSQEESTVSNNHRKSIYLEFENSENNQKALTSTAQRTQGDTTREAFEKPYRALLEKNYSQAIDHNTDIQTTNEVTDEPIIEQVATSTAETDEALEPELYATPLTFPAKSSESILASIGGATSFRKNSDGFGFTIDLSSDYLFLFDQDILTEESKVTLQRIITLYQQYDGLSIDITGHTDSKGSSSYNLKLSQRRADAVKQWFASKNIDATSITATGYGESQPVPPNTNSSAQHIDGRTLNRRINIATKTKLPTTK